MRTLLIMLSLVLLASACRSTGQTGDDTIIETTGTVTYVDLEGGFYGIISEEGVRYDPVNLDESFKEDGLRVRFRAEKPEDVAGIHMWGEIVSILAIERL